MGKRLIDIAMILCGLVLAVTPPALWFAWSVNLFVGFLVMGAAAGTGYCLLARYRESRFREPYE